MLKKIVIYLWIYLLFILRSLATANDALEVVEIMKYSLYATYADENDRLQFDRNLHGSGVSRNKMVKNLLNMLNRVC